jgi:hypothetical protein
VSAFGCQEGAKTAEWQKINNKTHGGAKNDVDQTGDLFVKAHTSNHVVGALANTSSAQLAHIA